MEGLAVCGRQGYVAERPDTPKFSLIFWRSLQIKLREALKHGTFFVICRKSLGSLPKVAPRGAGGDEPILRKTLATSVLSLLASTIPSKWFGSLRPRPLTDTCTGLPPSAYPARGYFHGGANRSAQTSLVSFADGCALRRGNSVTSRQAPRTRLCASAPLCWPAGIPVHNYSRMFCRCAHASTSCSSAWETSPCRLLRFSAR